MDFVYVQSARTIISGRKTKLNNNRRKERKKKERKKKERRKKERKKGKTHKNTPNRQRNEETDQEIKQTKSTEQRQIDRLSDV